MNINLPQIKKEGAFTKIKNWFKGLFAREKVTEQPVQEAIKEINNSVEEIKNDSFKASIKVESKDRILFLQRQLKEKQIEISDLTDEELDEMIELYEAQIEEKKEILKKYKEKLKNTKEEE